MKLSWSALIVMMVILAVSMIGGEAQNCGSQAGGKVCDGGNCCSQWGWCGKTPAHCGNGCQSQCSLRAAEAADAEPAGAAGKP